MVIVNPSDTIRVPRDIPSLEKALEVAKEGDTIVIEANVLVSDFLRVTKDITIKCRKESLARGKSNTVWVPIIFWEERDVTFDRCRIKRATLPSLYRVLVLLEMETGPASDSH